jgi:hypothetical protein
MREGDSMSMSRSEAEPPEVVFEKTEKGDEEIRTRKYNLPQKQRSVLIVVDGRKNRRSILGQFGDVGTVLDELERGGYIAGKAVATGVAALSPEEVRRRVEKVKNFMTNTVNAALGMMPSGRSFTDAVKQCRSLEELQEKLDPYLALIAGGSGQKASDTYRDELTKLLFPK